MISKHKFKVGDFVRCIKNQGDCIAGKAYRVIELYDSTSNLDAFWTYDSKNRKDAFLAEHFVLAGTPFQQALNKIAELI